MTLGEFRQKMRAYRDSVDREARSLKDSQAALAQLGAFYENLSQPERDLANTVLAEWTLDSDELLRFDALALIHMFHIRSANESLKRLAARLELSHEPSAPYEMKKVERLVSRLASHDGGERDPIE
jgi:hypothetical protein